ncbi:vitrin-like isoform X2 [Rhopilema esculentum]
MDIGIIMDASSSVRRKNYNKMKLFIKDMVNDFEISEKNVRFGIIHYSNYARLDFSFNDRRFHNRNNLKAKIDSIVYSYGGTRTDRALRLASRKLFCLSCSRVKARKVLIVITDGNTNRSSESLERASRYMKEQNVIILSLGIGNRISMSELLEIASEPKEKHVFKLNSFDDLKSMLNSIEEQACAKIL